MQSSQEVARHLDGSLVQMLGRGGMLDVGEDLVQEEVVHVDVDVEAKSRKVSHTAPQTRSMRIQTRSQLRIMRACLKATTPAFRERLGMCCSPLLPVGQTRERLDKDEVEEGSRQGSGWKT